MSTPTEQIRNAKSRLKDQVTDLLLKFYEVNGIHVKSVTVAFIEGWQPVDGVNEWVRTPCVRIDLDAL